MTAINKTKTVSGSACGNVHQMRSANVAGRRNVSTRDDLVFTRRDKDGYLINWDVPHDHDGYWHTSVSIGQMLFQDVIRLAANNPDEAYDAIRFAMMAFKPGGWGIETGFAEAVAQFAITGIQSAQRGKLWEPKTDDVQEE